MRRRRTIYFNDARHYYLFVFEPPMSLEDAWRPVDEVAGTSVDTFSYGVERGDGLFYPSKVGMRFGADIQPFEQAAYWRLWHNMQSLIDRGLDPLTVLIDRAHEKGMEFFASLRLDATQNGVSLRIQDFDSLPLIHADTNRLFNALYNLINNAIPETPVGGSVTVIGSLGPEEKTVIIRSVDTGGGMPPEIRERLDVRSAHDATSV